jgi:tetratricopeptide (TPR) repeat protein
MWDRLTRVDFGTSSRMEVTACRIDPGFAKILAASTWSGSFAERTPRRVPVVIGPQVIHQMLVTRSIQQRAMWVAWLVLLTPLPSTLSVSPALGQGVPTAGRAGGQPGPPQDRSDELSKDRYSSRQQATLEMWRQREISRAEVQQAARDPDPEVAGRAKWILRQWQRGSLPGVPVEISRRLRDPGDPGSVQELLEAGQFIAAVVAVEESIGTINREAIQRRVSSAITRRFPVYIKSALEDDSLPALLKLIDLSADSKEMAVCRVELMEHLGLDVDNLGLLPTAAESWPQRDRQHAMVLVQTVLNRMDDAVATARDSGDRQLLGICQMLAGRWHEMAIENVELARAAEVGSYERTRFWSQALIASDRCGEHAIFDEAARELATTGSVENRLVTELAWKSLLGHGEIDAALELLEQHRPDAAASVAMAAARGSRAFAALGLPLDQLDAGRKLETWIDDALATQKGVDEPTRQVRSALAMIRCLLTIGRDDAAWIVATRMCDSDVQVDGIPLREYVLSTLTMTQRRDWVLKLAQMAGEEVFSTITQSTLAGTIGDADRVSVEILMEAMATLKPGIQFEQRLELVYRLLDGQPGEGFDSALDFKRLFDLLATGKRQIQPRQGRAIVTPRVRLSMSIARMFSVNGRADLATKCLQYLADNRDVEATLEQAQREMDGGRAEAADEWFSLVWDRIEGSGQSRRYRAASENVDLASQALVGQWTLARRTGDAHRRDELFRQLSLTLCSPSTDTRNVLAKYLGDRGELELSMAAYKSLLPMAAFGTPGATVLYQVAWKHARLARDIDIDQAARWYDLAASGTLESTDYYRSEAYLTLPLDVRRWSLEAAIAQGDVAVARLHMDRILKLDPLDIDSAERLLPELRKAGMDSLADEAFEKIMDRGIEHAAEFPFDATSCNNVAWVAAMNRRRLEEGLGLSERAVFLEPDSAIYRDTLAEVLFQLGRKKEALEVEESCVLDDPSQWHLHQQIEKYRHAIAAEAAE